MKKINKVIQHQIDDLSDIEKLRIVDYILSELDQPDPEIDKAWVKEVSRRHKAVRAGSMKMHSYDSVVKKYLK